MNNIFILLENENIMSLNRIIVVILFVIDKCKLIIASVSLTFVLLIILYEKIEIVFVELKYLRIELDATNAISHHCDKSNTSEGCSKVYVSHVLWICMIEF